jgi:hypothetical protein
MKERRMREEICGENQSSQQPIQENRSPVRRQSGHSESGNGTWHDVVWGIHATATGGEKNLGSFLTFFVLPLAGGNPCLQDEKVSESTSQEGLGQVPRSRYVLCVVSVTTADWCDPDRIHQQVTIDILPDIVLLEIFDFYRARSLYFLRSFELWRWHTLVHVCQRWRYIIFASPRRLDLQLHCTERTPVDKLLKLWPPLPIMIEYRTSPTPSNLIGVDNIIAALKQHDRISSITLRLGVTNFERFGAVMQGPFPELTKLVLESKDPLSAVLPDTFLGGFAPRLRGFTMTGIPFPAFPKFLLSTASNLVHLYLEMPVTVYISPEAMAASLSAFTRLKTLYIGFQQPASLPNRMSQRPPSPIRTVLPTLIRFSYGGGGEYLEDFVAQIDAPHIICATIRFSNQLNEISQFAQFICRTDRLKSFNNATLYFVDRFIGADLSMLERDDPSSYFSLILQMPSKVLYRSVPSILQKFSPIFSSVTQLRIKESAQACSPELQHDMDNTQWLELFYPFTAVKSLHISGEGLYPCVAGALQLLTAERATDVWPALDSLVLEGIRPSGSVLEAFESFVSLRRRQASGQPIAIHDVCW